MIYSSVKSNQLLMKLFILLSVGFSTLMAQSFTQELSSKGLGVHISSDKPLSVGTNTLHLEIFKNKTAIKDVAVRVKVFMPAMPGMPAMKDEREAKSLGGGKYEVNVLLSMRGTWQLHIFILPETGKKMRLKSSLNF